MDTGDFIRTIPDSDNELVPSDSSDSDDDMKVPQAKGKRKQAHADFNENFKLIDSTSGLGLSGAGQDTWHEKALMFRSKRKCSTTLDEKIATIRKLGNDQCHEADDHVDEKEWEGSNSKSVEHQQEEDSDGIEFEKADEVKEKRRKGKQASKHRKMCDSDGLVDVDASYFDESFSTSTNENGKTFQDMNLSRPLLKAVSSMNFHKPTPIQSATIPVALLNRDICACAATGTGKTLAFMLPVLERLLYRPRQRGRQQTPGMSWTRVLVLSPTRELAVQIFGVSRQLAQFTDIEICLAAGGLDVAAQEAALRLAPDIVIATPGRLIDHLHNSPAFNLHSIEVLILDEADKMLDEYFAEQMKEIIRMCSITRQTMLFSATMTDQVKELACVCLDRPVRLFINNNTDLALNLRQEFVRIRANREGDREAVLAALVMRMFHDHCIVFVQTKKQTHRLHILLGLLGHNVGELHGNLNQNQRLEALKSFREGGTDILVATDLAARGLDIQGVKTVINFTMPCTVKHYVHRVGRTARAGKAGRSISLAGEQERKLLKEIVKLAKRPVKSRTIPADVVSKFRCKIIKLESDVEKIILLEKEEKEMAETEAKLNAAEKQIGVSVENRKADKQDKLRRTWFQSAKQKKQERAFLRLDSSKRLSKADLKKRGAGHHKDVTAESRNEYEVIKAQQFAARHAKRLRKPKRIRAIQNEEHHNNNQTTTDKRKRKRGENFAEELTNTNVKNVKMLRAEPSQYEKKEGQRKNFKEKQKNRMKKQPAKFKSKSRYKRR